MKESSSEPTKDDGSCAEPRLMPTRAIFDSAGRTHQCRGRMPTNKELLRSLRDGFEQLDTFDRSSLNSLRNRGQMSLGWVFGGNSLYKYQLSEMEFRPTFELSIDSWSGAIVARRW
jgi:hypothetical protein